MARPHTAIHSATPTWNVAVRPVVVSPPVMVILSLATPSLNTLSRAFVVGFWKAPQLSVDALMLPRAAQPAKVRAALDALTDYMSNLGRAPV